MVSFPSLIHRRVKERSLKFWLSGTASAGSYLQVTASNLIFSNPADEVSVCSLKMLSFSPRNVAVKKLCLNFSINLNFRLWHLLQMSQQSWVQLESPFVPPSEASGFMEKRNSPSLFEELVPSLWSKNVHPKILFSKEKGSVLDKLEMFKKQILCPFTLKITEVTAELWMRKIQTNFQEKYYLCKEKELLGPLFS